jgi:diketogulonate reductase-like aldo/keto reductase
MKTKSGKSLYPIGIGTWNISSRMNYDNIDSTYRGVEPVYGNEEQEIEALRYSILKGQNHIDAAEMYGGFYTDEVIGRAISGLKREDLFIADKLWKTSVRKGKVRATVEKMLNKLGTIYIDLLYIHAPWEGVAWQEAVAQIDELIDEGVVRYLGVSNFTMSQMQEVMALAKHPLAANQMNFNVLHKQEVSADFLEFCNKHDIRVVAYQPIKRQEVLADETVESIAKAHDATPAQVALAWLLQVGTLPIPKAVTKAHIDENLGSANVELTTEEMEQLEAIV